MAPWDRVKWLLYIYLRISKSIERLKYLHRICVSLKPQMNSTWYFNSIMEFRLKNFRFSWTHSVATSSMCLDMVLTTFRFASQIL